MTKVKTYLIRVFETLKHTLFLANSHSLNFEGNDMTNQPHMLEN